MDQVLNIHSISELNRLLGQDKTQHPLVSVIDFSKVSSSSYNTKEAKISSDFYALMFKDRCVGKMKYGRKYYDFQEGTLFCLAPGQVISVEKEDDEPEPSTGWGLFFHPDLIRGTALGKQIKDYSFFSYEANEALHLSDAEKQSLQECILKIEKELMLPIDRHSKTLIVSNIELLLHYCDRYYDRQFITRMHKHKSVISQFEQILRDYFQSEQLNQKGLPSVSYCAAAMHLSPNYLSDLLKKETGKNAQEHIHYKLIELAKDYLLAADSSVSEIAYRLGFDYPQYFSRLFKAKTGMTPASYRNQN